MRKRVLGLVMLGLATPALAQMGGMGQMGQHGGGRHGGGGRRGGGQEGGGERHAPVYKPVKRAHLDELVQAMFRELDTDRDGLVTGDEVTAVLAAKRDQIISDRFARIDTNHDKLIQPSEFLTWQRAAGDAVADGEEGGVNAGVPLATSIELPGHDKDEDRIIRRIVGPVDSVAIARANANYDKGASLDELLAYARAKFDAIDTDHDGELSVDELRAAKLGGGGEGRGGWRGRGQDDGGAAPPDEDGN